MSSLTTYITGYSDPSDASAYTFTSANIGTAASDRIVAVVIGARRVGAATSLSSVTIAGVSATVVAPANNSSSNNDFTAIALALVPDGTTGNIVLNFADTQIRCGIGIYNVTGASITPSNIYTSITTPPSVSIDVPVDGSAIGVGLNGGNYSDTWTGLTKDAALVLESVVAMSYASDDFALGATGQTVTISFSSMVAPVASVVVFDAASATPTITDINTDEIVAQGEASVTITGTTFEASQGTGTVKISPTDNIADGSVVTQTVTSWADTSIEFTANFTGTGIAEGGTGYVFVTNGTGDSNASGFAITREDITAPGITAPTSVIGTTTVTLGATADENGTAAISVYLTSEPTPPTGPEIIAGTYANEVVGETGLAVTAATPFTFSEFTGLTPGTSYTHRKVVVDAAGNYNIQQTSFTTKTATATLTTTGGETGLTGLKGFVIDSADVTSPTILETFTSVDMSGADIPLDLNSVSVTHGQSIKGMFESSDGTKSITVSGTVSIA